VPVPYVIEQTSRGEQIYDLYARLLKDRIVFLQGEINDFVANHVIAQLLFLDADDQDRDIYVYINSPGGYVSAGLAIYDTIQYLNSTVNTICIGESASMAAILLACGTPGKRFALPHSRVMIHQPLGGVTGQVSDVEIQARELTKTRETLNAILERHTNKDKETIQKDTDRNFYMTAHEALDYGIIDKVYEPKNQKK
jgi:ATP-dependent Clp protease, protease subunit